MNHQEILSRYDIKPKKSLGQNFLFDEEILEKISGVLDIQSKHVIEVGPGYGALTNYLLQKDPASLTLVEYDQSMISILEDRMKRGDLLVSHQTVCTIRNQDILTFFPTTPSVVIANIPYYITSPILFHFLYKCSIRPTEMVILMQKEVGQKILGAKPFGHSYLSLCIENMCHEVQMVCHVSAQSFTPAPKVDSIVLFFRVRNTPYCENPKFLSFLQSAFSHPRKKVISNLSYGGYGEKSMLEKLFTTLTIRTDERAENIDLHTWKILFESL